MPKHDMWELQSMQVAPLSAKIRMTERRIEEWIEYNGIDGVAISFSGGKDSTVLMDIIRNKMGYSEIPAVFVDVPTQFPELREFAMTWPNVEILKPKQSFMQVCERYGFPLISKEVAHKFHDLNTAHEKGNECYVDRQLAGEYVSSNGKSNMVKITQWAYMKDAPFKLSHMCCNIMKKNPLHEYQRKHKRYFITAQMASESMIRAQQWVNHGCNMYDIKNPISNPMSFWTEQDVLLYIKENNLPICSVYGDVITEDESTGQMSLADFGLFDLERPLLKTTGCDRTGCMLCGFGCHLEKKHESRFLRLKETHPGMYKLLDVVKNNGVTMREAMEWMCEHGDVHIYM